MNIAFTWHRDIQLFKTLKEKNIKYNEFLDILEKEIKNNHKKQNIYFVWWSDWFDNIIWNILVKLWYKYILKLSEKDITIRKYRNKYQKNIFNTVYKNAYKIEIIKWWYIKRDKELIKNANILIAFIDDNRIKNSWTWITINLFFKKNNWKKISIKNINNWNFLKIIK